jgi:hypothetical protein
LSIAGIPVDFLLFGLTLLGVALFHRYVLQVALIGLGVIIVYKLGFTGFKTGAGMGVAHGARVGDPRQPARPAAGLRAAFQPFRAQQGA